MCSKYMLQCIFLGQGNQAVHLLTLTVLVATIDAQWEGMGDVGSARYEPALLPACPTVRVLTLKVLVATIDALGLFETG